MKALKTVPIQVTSKTLPVVIPVVQSDSGRSIEFVISDMTIPTEATAVLYVLKKDLNKGLINCAINNNTVTVNLTTDTLAVAGIVRCQIKVISGDDVVTTFEFALDVQGSIFDDSAAESGNEFSALIEALQKVNNLVSGVKGDAESNYRTGQINLTPANLGAAPISHASAATTYGIGTTANYGHCMTINNLTATAHENGKALGAYQGAVLKESIDALQASLNALPKFISGTVVLTISGTAGVLFTLAQLRTMFGTTEFGTNNITTVIANGDGDA
ncbi:hypothetical protein QE152_g38934 [Popillia japonica]|uniref:BppU N-terminal domain-containing protein n=1 Tax=Popillia japonica TaxID=7064 RepID=A0AAW1HVC9_POPJA